MNEDTSTPTPKSTNEAPQSPADVKPYSVSSAPGSANRIGGLADRARLSWRSRSSGARRTITTIVACVVLAAAAGFGGGWLAAHPQDTTVTGSLTQQKKVVTSESQLIHKIFESVGPSVVSVNTTATTSTQDIFGYSQDQTSSGAGTGMIISKSGIIMTNRHVVPAGTTDISVTLADGTKFDDVELLGRTSSSDSLDVAFIKIKDLKGKSLTPVTIGDSSDTAVGDAVAAIGNALGQFQNTLTSGIISGFGRSVEASDGGGQFTSATSTEDLDNLIQTDAAINAGNSGGPLVNMNGQVIGINTAIASDAQNIGFAIPINDVKGLITQVLTTGSFKRPYLGVRYVPVTDEISKQFALGVKQGAFILPQSQTGKPPVVADSPADKAGLKGGDVVTKIDDEAITSDKSLTTILNHYEPGKKVTLTVVRDGKTLKLDATLGTASDTSQ